MRTLLLIVALSMVSAGALAIDADGPLEDPALQARFERLTWELRCLVCQNQNIADSNAALAKDLRAQVREMLLAGRSDDEILTYMTERYGDFVLYRPTFAPKNWLLWVAPLLLLGGGAWLLVSVVRRQAVRADQGAGNGNAPEPGNTLDQDEEAAP